MTGEPEELREKWKQLRVKVVTLKKQAKSNDLHWAMTLALVGNKPEFVSLLLESGLCLRDFLKDDNTLCELYKQLPDCFFLYKLAKRVNLTSSNRDQAPGQGVHVPEEVREKISLTHVSDEVRHLLGQFTQHIYPSSAMTYHLDLSTEDISSSVSKDQTMIQDLLRQNRAETQRDPGSDLFLWAIIQNNKELSEIAWDQCRDCMSAALAASKILKKMAEESIDADEPQEMLDLANYFENRAIGVFSKCYNSDKERAQKLLVRSSCFWGKTTCLRLALEADDKNFVAQSGVQIWCGELSVENPVWRVLVCMVFFPLIYTRFVVFSKPNVEPLSCWSRLVGLYCSPQVKFYGNIVSYFAFLFLFAVVLMVDFQSKPSIVELVLYFWLFSLVCEEIRQLFYDPDGFGFRKKAKRYIHEMWNILDVISIVLFCLGLSFRLTAELFYAGKIILCIDFVVFCLRVMAIFTISRTLGPKIIIVRKMIMDMFFFMFLLSIWVVAYGVAKQGILIQNDNRLDWILRGAIYEPYLIIFGSFPENIDNAAFDINSCSMNGTDPLKPKCPVLNENQMPVFPEWLTILMLCIYLLFANILLLNLLIAIFNYTFEEVHDNTDRIWKFQRYELIKEYHSRPAAPPPFIIFSHLYLFIRKIVLFKAPILSTEFKKQLSQIEEEELLSWEALMKDRHLLSAQQEQSQSMERRILDTSQKCLVLMLLTQQVMADKLSLHKIASIGSIINQQEVGMIVIKTGQGTLTFLGNFDKSSTKSLLQLGLQTTKADVSKSVCWSFADMFSFVPGFPDSTYVSLIKISQDNSSSSSSFVIETSEKKEWSMICITISSFLPKSQNILINSSLGMFSNKQKKCEENVLHETGSETQWQVAVLIAEKLSVTSDFSCLRVIDGHIHGLPRKSRGTVPHSLSHMHHHTRVGTASDDPGTCSLSNFDQSSVKSLRQVGLQPYMSTLGVGGGATGKECNRRVFIMATYVLPFGCRDELGGTAHKDILSNSSVPSDNMRESKLDFCAALQICYPAASMEASGYDSSSLIILYTDPNHRAAG
ncbi:hypothetical protein CCH79_00002932 [Gambusia affinis]|uniref:Uncharacterized protein n=1 Tax=Gambusia affinis TaxID=33528 RepID=A0A315W6A0_GAMAF|nr:hypothetical protein CCH79_00002932 [Gambusia affinis]